MKKIYLLFFFFTSFIYAQEPFIFTWQVENTVMIPPVVGIDNNFTINFGDGVVLTNQVQSLGHIYESPGVYTVTISGDFNRVKFENSWQNLLTVEQWGDTQWSSMEGAFAYCENLVINATDIPDLSQVTSMKEMFYACTLFNQSLNDWDVSSVTDMTRLFYAASSFNQPLNNWDVSNVTTMFEMFSSATSFNQPLDNWDVSNVTTMLGMFRDATSFNQPLNNWDTANVTGMYQMFYNADSFNQPLNNWNVSNVTDMASMFEKADAFNQPLEDWDVSNVVLMEEMFYENQTFNQPLNNWDVSSVINMNNMFAYSNYNQPLNNWDVSSVTNMSSMFVGNTLFNQPLNNWDVSNVVDMSGMFAQASVFNQPLNAWNVSNVIEMGGMFTGASEFNQDLTAWNFNPNVNLHLWASEGNFLTNSGLDIINYDALLLKFVQLELHNKYLGAGGLKYCDEAVRNYLINELGWTITGDSLGEECVGNAITGSIVYDQDNNGCGTGDGVLDNVLISANSGQFNYVASANNDGAYNLTVPENNYNVQLLNIPSYYTVNPVTSPLSFTGVGNSEQVNFCLTANQTVNDLNVTLLPVTEARPGFEGLYQIVVQNMGTQTAANAAVSLIFDNTKQSFVSAVPAAASTTANQLNFTLANLQPFESRMININMQTFTPNTVNGGDILNFTAAVTPDANDFTPDDNTFNFAQVVVNSFDPNDKQVLQGDEIFIDQADEYLDYIIRFQNTGTASAVNVMIEDNLHEKLDWTTLQPVSSSHDYRLEITEGNQVKFIFDNINLPHQEANDAGSNGFIAYKIKPVANTQVGDIFEGDAAIFFDYNMPIITNMVSTEVVTNLGVTQYAGQTVSIYPNPAGNILNVQVQEGIEIKEVVVYNLQGRQLKYWQQSTGTVNVEDLSAGVYLLTITTSAGTSTHKLVKK